MDNIVTIKFIGLDRNNKPTRLGKDVKSFISDCGDFRIRRAPKDNFGRKNIKVYVRDAPPKFDKQMFCGSGNPEVFEGTYRHRTHPFKIVLRKITGKLIFPHPDYIKER